MYASLSSTPREMREYFAPEIVSRVSFVLILKISAFTSLATRPVGASTGFEPAIACETLEAGREDGVVRSRTGACRLIEERRERREVISSSFLS